MSTRPRTLLYGLSLLALGACAQGVSQSCPHLTPDLAQPPQQESFLDQMALMLGISSTSPDDAKVSGSSSSAVRSYANN